MHIVYLVKKEMYRTRWKIPKQMKSNPNQYILQQMGKTLQHKVQVIFNELIHCWDIVSSLINHHH